MGRRPRHVPLGVYLNNRRVGTLIRETSEAISFAYHEDWLAWEHALPVSLSLPMRETRYRGAPVAAVFENLLPDSDMLRRRVAERVGARGMDAFSLLSVIGRDCVGALQFLQGDREPDATSGGLHGEPLDEAAIEKMLTGLAQAPLGLSRDDDFRISVAGAQEKTALLWNGGAWSKPHGTTPTTHIFKTQIGRLPNGIDLSDSVENEFYCLKLTEAFGLPVNEARIQTFGATKALVIERFDRRWTRDGRLIRLPQEDFCQALSVPPTLKYQSDGGPGVEQVLALLQGSDTPTKDQDNVFKAQLVYWLMGATDGHAKNFSVQIGPGGRYRLTPFYDVLSAQPSLVARQVERKQMKLAMSIGTRRHYRIDQIHGRHFVQTGIRAGFSRPRAIALIEEIADTASAALDSLANRLPPDFPPAIHETIATAITERLRSLVLARDSPRDE